MTRHHNHGKIGGTLACVIAKGNHFGKTPFSEWQVLTGQKKADDLSGKFPVQLGIWTEPLNAIFFQKRSGHHLDRGDAATGVHIGEPNYMVCQPDGFVYPKDGRKCLFEAKHTSQHTNMEEQLERYLPQLQHNMYVTDCDAAFFSVIFGTREPEYVEVGRNDKWIKEYLPLAEEFWRCVVTKTPPSIGRPIENGEIKIYGHLRVDKNHPSHNEFHSMSLDYLETMPSVKMHEEAKTRLKELAPEDIKITEGDLLEVRRDRRGRATIRTK